MEEIFDVYTKEGKYLGKKPKSFCHSKNPRCYHKPVWIWIINDKKEILIQKRADIKKNHPNKWDMSSAGHVVSGETIIEGAIRETLEELGIKTKKEDYTFLFEYVFEEGFELAQVHLLKVNVSIDEMILQKEEVKEVKWVSYDTFKEIFLSDEFCPEPTDYKEKILKILK